MMHARKPRRRGAAIIYAMVILAVLGIMMGETSRCIMSARRQLALRHDHLQAEWCVRSGIEWAIAKLRDNPSYSGETIELMPGINAMIKVESQAIRCELKYPASDGSVIHKTATRSKATTS